MPVWGRRGDERGMVVEGLMERKDLYFCLQTCHYLGKSVDDTPAELFGYRWNPVLRGRWQHRKETAKNEGGASLTVN